jgi:hypothetical protein
MARFSKKRRRTRGGKKSRRKRRRRRSRSRRRSGGSCMMKRGYDKILCNKKEETIKACPNPGDDKSKCVLEAKIKHSLMYLDLLKKKAGDIKNSVDRRAVLAYKDFLVQNGLQDLDFTNMKQLCSEIPLWGLDPENWKKTPAHEHAFDTYFPCKDYKENFETGTD